MKIMINEGTVLVSSLEYGDTFVDRSKLYMRALVNNTVTNIDLGTGFNVSFPDEWRVQKVKTKAVLDQ